MEFFLSSHLRESAIFASAAYTWRRILVGWFT
jgi:hypothetical protein